MKTNSVLKLLILAVVLIVSVSFAGCNLDGNGLQLDDSGLSRKMSNKTEKSLEIDPTGFTATVLVGQVEDSVVTKEPSGNSNRYKTLEETLVGTVETSSWTEFIGAEVIMQNVTNYEQVFLNYNYDYGFEYSVASISGTNHSTITITMKNLDGTSGEVITLKANGKIDGDTLQGAMVDMKFNSTGQKGQSKSIQMKGALSGLFIWFAPQAYGTFDLIGTYK